MESGDLKFKNEAVNLAGVGCLFRVLKGGIYEESARDIQRNT